MPSISPAFRRLAVLPSVLLLSAVALLLPSPQAHAQTTTFTGKVYSPAGPTNGDPIPNILVFIADPNNPPPAFTQGITIPASGQNGCDAQPNLVPTTVLGEGLTDPTGTYTFQVVGSLPNPMNVVIQAGKWRLQTSMDSSVYTAGGSYTLPNLSMPSKQIAGVADLPHIAVVTGSADQIECIFRQIGINDSEVTDPAGGGSINLFAGTQSSGEVYGPSSPKEAQLLNPNATGAIPLTNYDLVMFGCQGTATDATASSYASNLVPYANEGGRVFATHYGYVWLKDPPAWTGVATWITNGSSFSVNEPVTVDTSYAGGKILESWLQGIGALDVSTSPPELNMNNIREDTSAVTNPPAQSWGVETNRPTHSIQFTFNTPIGASGTPSVAVTYTNNTTQFLQGDTNDTITLTVTNNSTAPTTPGLQMAISIPSNITVTSAPVDSSGGSWVCVGTSPTSTCTLPVALAGGASDSVLLTFSIATNATVGQASLTAALSGGGLSNSGQCGRVLFNDYHVEEPVKTVNANTYYNNGALCPQLSANPGGKLVSAQKFLEYSLYNLSNFVSPSTTDLLLIQGASKLTWTPAATTFYYGTPYTPNSQLDDATSAIAGSFVYTANSTVNPLDVGTWTITATFTPTDPDYVPSSTSTKITILSDPTSSALTVTGALPTIYYGQPLTALASLSAAVSINVVAPGYTAQPVNAGPYAITVDGNVACTGTAGGANTCGSPTVGTLDAGTHNVQLAYSGTTNTDFLSSNSPLYPVVIVADPTTTTMTASTTASINLQPITFTAQVADQYAAPVGPVIFYDSTTTASQAGNTPVGSPIGSVAVDSTGKAVLTSTTVFTGTHNISACFTPGLNSLNTYNYVLSCSASTQVIVTTTAPSSPVPTFTLVTSSANPSSLGQAVSFTASVATSGAFTSTPAGSIAFFDGGTQLYSTTLAADGTAVFTTSALAVGSHPITAVYAGNAITAGSTSAVLTQLVNTTVPVAGTGFLLLMNSTGINVPIGGSGSLAIRVVELSNFNQPIKLTCAGLPAETTCSFSTDTISAAGGTTVLTVSAAAPHDCNSNSPYFISPSGETGILALATLTLCLARRRRKLQGLALAVVLCLLPALLTGCGSNCTDFGVKPGTYTFSITGTSTGSPVVVQTQAMTMNAHL